MVPQYSSALQINVAHRGLYVANKELIKFFLIF